MKPSSNCCSTFLGVAVLLATLTLPLGVFGQLIQQTTEDFVNHGDTKYLKGDSAGAIAYYSKTIELDPKSASLYIRRGNAKSGDLDSAIADFTKAIELDPKSADAYARRGNAKYGKGDWEGAIADCSKAIELNPKKADAFLTRANAKKAKGDQVGADTDFAQAFKWSDHQLRPR